MPGLLYLGILKSVVVIQEVVAIVGPFFVEKDAKAFECSVVRFKVNLSQRTE